MKIDIPPYITGFLDGQYRGDKGDRVFLKHDRLTHRARKYSIVLYKDLHIYEACPISETEYKVAIENPDWWKIDHTANAAIDFLAPFFEQFTFLRHRPVEIYVEHPKIQLVDKRSGFQKTYGKLSGRVIAKLVEPARPNLYKNPIIETVPEPLIHEPNNGDEIPMVDDKSGCWKNYSNRLNGCFGMRDGVSGTGGCYGLSGGPRGFWSLTGNYGNSPGCYTNPVASPGCLPNLGLGCLLPVLLLGLLFFAVLRSCEHARSLAPVVDAIKKDRDDSRIPPPLWVDDTDTVKADPEYVPLADTGMVIIDTSLHLSDTSAEIRSARYELDSLKRTLKKGQVLVELWDWSRADNDSVTVFFNNRLVGENIVLRKSPFLFVEDGLRYGENYVVIMAVNSQKGMNTAGLRCHSDRGMLCDTLIAQNYLEIMRLTLNYQ
jgi:hypothetical protein